MTESVASLAHFEGGGYMGKARRRGGRGMSKIRSLKIHLKKRAPGRYGVELTNDDLRVLVQKIQQGKGDFVEKQSNRVSRWLIEHLDRTWDLVYDKERHCIITCLSARDQG